MWKVIYIAPNSKTAERIRELLTAAGLLVTLRPLGSNGSAELLVPRSEAAEALEILNQLLSGHTARSQA